MGLTRAASLKANCLIQAYGLCRLGHETAPPSRNGTKSFDSLRIQIAENPISLLSSCHETIQKVWDKFRRFGRLSMLRLGISKLPKPPEPSKPHSRISGAFVSPQCGVSCQRRMTIPVRVKRLRTRWQREALSRKRAEAIQSRSPRFVIAAVFVVAPAAQENIGQSIISFFA